MMARRVHRDEFEERITNIEDSVNIFAEALDKLTKALAENTATLKNIQGTQDRQTKYLEDIRDSLKGLPSGQRRRK